MKRITTVSLMLLSLFTSPMAQEKKKAAPAHKMVEFQMALLKRAPGWEDIKTANPMALEQQQTLYVKALIERGNATSCGGPASSNLANRVQAAW